MTPRILWAALLFSQFLYLVLLAMLGVVERPEVPAEPMLLFIVTPVAIAAALASYLVPRFLERGPFGEATLETQPIEGAVSSAAHRTELGPRGFVDREAALALAVQRGLMPFIVGCALNESVAVLGFLLGFLGHPWLVVLPFFLAAWLMMLTRIPTERRFLAPLARAYGVQV